MEELRALQKKREELRVKLKEAEARYDLAMVADLRRAPAAAAKRGAGQGQALYPSLCRGLDGAAAQTHDACIAWRAVIVGCHTFLDAKYLSANMPYASCRGARARLALAACGASRALSRGCHARTTQIYTREPDSPPDLQTGLIDVCRAQVWCSGRHRGGHPGQGQEPAAGQHAQRRGVPSPSCHLPALNSHTWSNLQLCVQGCGTCPCKLVICYPGAGHGGGCGGGGVALDRHPRAAAVREREGAPAAPGRGAAPAHCGCVPFGCTHLATQTPKTMTRCLKLRRVSRLDAVKHDCIKQGAFVPH